MKQFAKYVAIMSMAPLITQGLSLLLMPIIARLFLPSDFGLAALFGAIVMPFAIFSNMGYSSAIVVPKSEDEAYELVAINLFFTFLVSISSAVLVLLFGGSFLQIINAEELNGFLWLVPLMILFNGLFMTFRFWNIRKQRFGILSFGKVMRFVVENTINLTFGLIGYVSSFILIISSFFGGVINTLILVRPFLRKSMKLYISALNVKTIIETAKKNIKFPKYIIINDFFSRFAEQLPILLFSYFFSQAVIGFYALALRLLVAPMNLFGNAIGEVFFQEASKNRNEIPHVLQKLFFFLFLIGFPLFTMLSIMGEELFIILFGKEWQEAGGYSQILSLLIFVKFITIPSSFLMLLYNKQEYSLFLNMATLIVGAFSLIVGGFMNSVTWALILYSSLNSIVYAIYGFGFMLHAGLNFRSNLSKYAKVVLLYSPFFAIVLYIKTITLLLPVQFLLIASGSLLLFYGILSFFDSTLKGVLRIVVEKVRLK